WVILPKSGISCMKRKMAVSLVLLLGFLWLGDLSLRSPEQGAGFRNFKDGGDGGEETIQLQFVSSSTQAPIAGVQVALFGPGKAMWGGRTKTDGRFPVSGLISEDFPYWLRGDHADFQGIDWRMRGSWLLSADTLVIPLIEELSREDVQIQYRCDRDAHLLVSWRWHLPHPYFSPPGRVAKELITAKDQVVDCVIEDVPMGAFLRVITTDLQTGQGDFFEGNARSFQSSSIRLLHAVTLRGRVENLEGRALAGVSVRLLPSFGAEPVPSFDVETDEIGEFELGVPRWWANRVEEGGGFGVCDLTWQGQFYPQQTLVLRGERLKSLVIRDSGAPLQTNK
ncbi:MAG: hypothetical protein ACI97A_003042, partial [Planctomycetota bacterium]